jgi:lysozyme
MRLSQSGFDFLRHEEGLRLEAYPDAGKWAIGIGCQTYQDGTPVKEGDKISEWDAIRLATWHIERLEEVIAKVVEVELSQQQWDALDSLGFNIGTEALANSTLVRKLNAGDFAGAAAEFDRWNRSQGVVNEVLVARRKRERALFESGVALPGPPPPVPTVEPAPIPVPPATPPMPHRGGEGEPQFPDWPFTESTMPAQQKLPKETLTGIVRDIASVIPEVGKLFLDSTLGVPARNIQAVTLMLEKLTGATKPADVPAGAWNAASAASAIVSDPLAASRARAVVVDDLDRLTGMVVRMQETDDASADRAAERLVKDPAIAAETDDLINWIMAIFVGLILAICIIMGIQAWFNEDHEPAISMMVIFASLVTGVLAIVTGIYAYRFGMKQGADAANAAIKAMQR